MKRATAFALFVALATAPALAITVNVGAARGIHVVHGVNMSTILSRLSRHSRALSPLQQTELMNGRPIQCETTVYTNQRGFFVGHEMTYAALGSCPLLPVTFLDSVAPLPPELRYPTGLTPILLPADDFDSAGF